MFQRLLRKWGGNPLDGLLKKAQKNQHKRFLLFWNRGLGDIALGLHAIVHRIRAFVPDAKITFLTRENLRDGFILLGGVDILVAPTLKRGAPAQISTLLRQLNVDLEQFDVILEKPDPTQWVRWQLGTLTPLLHWQEKWEKLWEKYDLQCNERYIGAHVQTETNYGHWRNWPLEQWVALLEGVTERGVKVLLFGFEKNPEFDIDGVIDLRGNTPLFDLLSIIKNRCEALVVPDSGVSSMIYFLNTSFPLKLVSLWADPYMGILKQNVASPNPHLKHIPLIGKDKNIANISVKQVEEAIFS